jgi:hypothetical protein
MPAAVTGSGSERGIGGVRRCAPFLPPLHSRPMTSPRPPQETAPQDVIPRDAARFRRTLVLVLAVQVITLVALWLMQLRYSA